MRAQICYLVTFASIVVLVRLFPILTRQHLRSHTISKRTFTVQVQNATPWDRAVFFSVFGAQKSGTSAISSYLEQHPSIVGYKSTFFHWRFGDFIGPKNSNGTTIKVKEAREAIVNYYFPDELKANTSLVAFDNWPDNLYRSIEVAPRFRRSCPRSKIVVILRDPVERAYSHYSMEYQRNKKIRDAKMTLEEFIEPDLENLHKFQITNSSCTDEGRRREEPSECDSLWENYLRKSRIFSAVGRGLYSIQLRHLFREYDKWGGGRENIVVFEYDELYRNGAQAAYDRVTDFLGLPRHTLKNTKPVRVGKYNSPMNATTRKLLSDIFEPFTCQLPELLGKNWQQVWNVTCTK